MWISRHVCKYMIVKEIWPLSDRSKRFRNPNVYIRDLDDTTMRRTCIFFYSLYENKVVLDVEHHDLVLIVFYLR